ncbi:MAG: hypothetical protein ACREK2_03365 [Gemmatimonadota bacterium]
MQKEKSYARKRWPANRIPERKHEGPPVRAALRLMLVEQACYFFLPFFAFLAGFFAAFEGFLAAFFMAMIAFLHVSGPGQRTVDWDDYTGFFSFVNDFFIPGPAARTPPTFREME